MAFNVTLSGEAEQQVRSLRDKLGGSIPQIVRQAIKHFFDFHFPPQPKST